MISNTKQAARELLKLPIETFLLVVDENDNEYLIESIVKRKLHMDSVQEWCYAFRIRQASEGCIKR